MKWLFSILLLFPLLTASGQVAETNSPAVRFLAVDVFIDSKDQPLAAYQIEFADTNGVAKIVGIEGGEHPVFSEPPHYDPQAIQRERVIIADFSTKPAGELPNKMTRVATIHLQVSGTNSPQFSLRLQAAANAKGRRIHAEVTVQERTR